MKGFLKKKLINRQSHTHTKKMLYIAMGVQFRNRMLS